jgi:membrane protein implicated in regulation of membrane protease activity
MLAWFSAERLLILNLLLLGGGVLAALGLTFVAEADDRWPALGPAVAVAGVTCFGGAGVLALRLFGLGPGRSLLAAALFAATSAALFAALALAARRAAARRAALADLVGALARVVAPIEPGGCGTITTNGRHPALTLTATARQGRALPAGATVVVTGLRGETAEVAPLDDAPLRDWTPEARRAE